MKYWRGYLVAAITAAVAWAFVQFADAHSVLVDMIYPYVSRMLTSSLADWTGSMSFCLWQVLLIGLVVAGIASIILMVVLRWNFFQWLGWVCATVSCIFMLNTVVYELNAYASPLADDIRLEITDYTVSELNEATVYFRDQANALAQSVARDEDGDPAFGTFDELAAQAADGYEALTYDQAISVFAGSTAPVKKLGWSGFYGRDTGVTVPLTGEAAVNPRVPAAVLPYAMCKEIAHRMCIYSEADADFAAFLSGISNSSEAFQYSAYLMAYRYCYDSLSSIPTSTAQACAAQTDSGVNDLLRHDLQVYTKFFGKGSSSTASRTVSGADTTDATDSGEVQLITFSSYSTVTDLLASWYIQNYIVPLHLEEEEPFNPLDASQVDLTNTVPEK